jgi:mannose-6-phosphate isomerase-like protein (cupin superfamily)
MEFMREMSRREMCVGLSALAAVGSVKAEGQSEVQPAAPTQAAGTLAQARVFTLEQMPVRKMANGGESRDVLRGALPTGEVIAIHESEQPVGLAPNTPHTIQHSEIIVIIQGTVVFEHDGKSDKVGQGGVIYVAPGTLHTLHNVGDTPARYCVVQVGGDIRR